MTTALKELEEPKNAPLEPLAARKGQTGLEEHNGEEDEEDYGEYFS